MQDIKKLKEVKSGMIVMPMDCNLKFNNNPLISAYPRIVQEVKAVVGKIEKVHLLGRTQIIDLVPRRLVVSVLYCCYNNVPTTIDLIDEGSLKMCLYKAKNWMQLNFPRAKIWMDVVAGENYGGDPKKIREAIIAATNRSPLLYVSKG